MVRSDSTRDRSKVSVINEQMLRECAQKQQGEGGGADGDDRGKVSSLSMLRKHGGGGGLGGDTGAGGDGAQEERSKVELHEVTCLMLSYRSVARVDNLVGVANLTRLYLDNNNITTIENLGHLVHLRWLDLSFNKIQAIEGLETLVQLEDLSLYSNEIAQLKGLDTLTQLRCLSLGRNRLETLEDVAKYLHKFKNMRMLTLMGNKVEQQAHYKARLLGYIPKLRYLDNRLIFAAEVAKAKEDMKEHLIPVDEADRKEDEQQQLNKQQTEEIAEYTRANVPNEHKLLEHIFNLEPDNRQVSISQLLETDFVKEKVKEFVEQYHERFVARAKEMADRMKDLRKRKDGDARDFGYTLDDAKKRCDTACKHLIKDFERKMKKVIPFGLKAKPDPDLYDDQMVAALHDELRGLKAELLEKEADQIDAYESAIAAYEDVLNDAHKTEATEILSTGFDDLRQLEKQFSSDLKNRFDTWHKERQHSQENAGADGGDVFVSPTDHGKDKQLLAVLDNKDDYSKTLQEWTDFHCKKLEELETQHASAEVEQAKKISTDNAQAERVRSRSRIEEIHAYVERTEDYINQWEHLFDSTY